MKQWQWKLRKAKNVIKRKVKLIFLLAIIAAFTLGKLTAPSSEEPVSYGNTTLEYATRVIDGDTFIVGKEHIRIMGIDTPELKAKCSHEKQMALAARDYAIQLLSSGFTLNRQGKDRYGRTLATVILANGSNFTQSMLSAGHGRQYSGGRRSNWCD